MGTVLTLRCFGGGRAKATRQIVTVEVPSA